MDGVDIAATRRLELVESLSEHRSGDRFEPLACGPLYSTVLPANHHVYGWSAGPAHTGSGGHDFRFNAFSWDPPSREMRPVG